MLTQPPTLIALFALIVLCGCSSGGGGRQPADTEISIPPLETGQNTDHDNSQPPWNSFQQQPMDADNHSEIARFFESEEYNGMGALDTIHASSAYARGATGAGVRVGLIDSGVYKPHSEFSTATTGDKVHTAGSDYSSANPRSNSAISHGTMVAGVIAANRDDSPVDTGIAMHGVAFDANLLAYEIPLGSAETPYNPVDIGDITFGDDNYFANRFTLMANQVDIINISFGFPGVITSYSKAQVEAAFNLSLDALRQRASAREERAIFVIAAGNAWNDTDDAGQPVNADSPELLPGLPYLFPELKEHMLAVVAADDSGEIAFYSNRCGVAADFCLTAPGGGDGNNNHVIENHERIWSPTSPNDTSEVNTNYYAGAVGTSFAAPLVSGSLALLKQMFPTVGNHELVSRLLSTANKTGIYADSAIYGQGLLDLNAATSPVGGLAIASGGNLDAGLLSLTNGTIDSAHGVLGASLLRALTDESIALFDQQGFPFHRDASVLIKRRQQSSQATLKHRQHHLDNGARLQLGRARSGVENGNAQFHPDAQNQDYFALQIDNPTGNQRFIGINANPGWFFGVYSDNLVTPASDSAGNRFAAPWLRLAQHGISSGGDVDVGKGTLRAGLFQGSAVDKFVSLDDKHKNHGGLFEYSLSPLHFKVHPDTSLSLNIQAGFIREQDSLLGTTVGSALGQFKQSSTRFAGINGYLQLGAKWQGIFALYQGITDRPAGATTQPDTPLLDLESAVRSQSWALSLYSSPNWQRDDQLSITLQQPLRVDSGHGRLRIASDRTPDRQVRYKTIHFDLQPKGREQHLELHYQFKWGRQQTHEDTLNGTVRDSAQQAVSVSVRVEYHHQPEHNPLNRGYGLVELSLFKPLSD